MRVICLALAALLVAAPAASASTTVTGDGDRTSPLVIDPSGDSEVDGAWNMLFFIQKMPVTKTVNRVTIGDIALDPACTTTDPVLKLFVRQHSTGALREQTQLSGWEGNALEEIPADQNFERRTWRTEPMTLVKGRGYSFWVQGTLNNCTSFRVRSWSHNGPKVNAGDDRCDVVVGGSYRMWHVQGENDAVPCPGDNVPSNFQSTMPTGWLSVNSYFGYTYVETQPIYEQGPDPPTPTCPSGLGSYGGIALRWRDWNGNPDWGEYVCIWDAKFADWLPTSSPFYPNDPDDGWYYGLGPSNAVPTWPRDLYLKLDLDEEELAAWYKPNLYFDSSEKWRPLDLDEFFDERDASGDFLNRNCFKLVGAPGPPPEVCGPVYSPDDLMEHNDSDAHLKINGPDAEDDEDYRSPDPACNTDGLYDCNGGLSTSLYDYVSRPLVESEYRYIGYWAFYRFNDFGEIGDHEGDWEGVALAPSYDRPGTFDFASFSSHGPWYSYLRDTLRCADSPYWFDYECGTESQKEYSHVKTYVANGSHANYPAPCDSNVVTICDRAAGLPPAENDYDGARSWAYNTSGTGPQPSGIQSFPQVDGTHWVDWTGSWGWTNSPASPARQEEFFDPWSGCGWGEDCSTPAARAVAGRGLSKVRRRAGPAHPPFRCRRWFGPQVAAVACDRARLRRSIATGTLGRSGKVHLRVRRRVSIARRHAPAPTASSRGLAQAIGNPLTIGDRLVIRKPRGGQIALLVRVQVSGRLYEAHFTRRQLRGRRGVVRIRRRKGDPVVVMSTPGVRRTIPHVLRRVAR